MSAYTPPDKIEIYAPALACVVVRAVVVHRRDMNSVVGGCDKPSHGVVLSVGLAGRTTWPSQSTGAGLANVIRRREVGPFWRCACRSWAFAPEGVVKKVECAVHGCIELWRQGLQFPHGEINCRVQDG